MCGEKWGTYQSNENKMAEHNYLERLRKASKVCGEYPFNYKLRRYKHDEKAYGNIGVYIIFSMQ